MKGLMIGRGLKSVLLAACLAIACGVGATSAGAAADDPLFVYTPKNAPPTFSQPFEGPCGLAVDSTGHLYVSDYYHQGVRAYLIEFNPLKGQYEFKPSLRYVSAGPCGISLDAADNLYVNVFHSMVQRLTPPTAVIDPGYATGVVVNQASGNIYVTSRTYVGAFEPSGSPVLEGADPLKIGLDPLGDYYGLAVSEYSGTAGRVYVADAADNTVKAYDPGADNDNPVQIIAGPGGASFVSLRDSALAVDRVTGNVYIADNRQPEHAGKPEAAIYVFAPTGGYLGRLKYNIVDALPPGLAVDNSSSASQGRVYVTSGNTVDASVIAYPPGAQTTATQPPISSLVGMSTITPSDPHADARLAGDCSTCEPSDSSPEAEASEVTQKGPLRLAVNGQLSPRKLPREAAAPVAATVGWKVATTDGSAVPSLRNIEIEINRHGHFETEGLPICPYDRIQPASSSRALSNCRQALVGQGSFTADIALEGQEPYAAKGRLLVFNGVKGGKPVLFGQIYSPYPFSTSFVIVFKVKRIGNGTYGTALSATLPKALTSWGNLTGIEMTLSRRYSYRGESHSYLSATCPAPRGFPGAVFPFVRASFDFDDGLKSSSTLARSCKVR